MRRRETWVRVVPRPKLGIHPPPCPVPAMLASRNNEPGGDGGDGGDDNHRSYVGSRLTTRQHTETGGEERTVVGGGGGLCLC